MKPHVLIRILALATIIGLAACAPVSAPAPAPSAAPAPTTAQVSTQASADQPYVFTNPKGLTGKITVSLMASGTYDKAAADLAAQFKEKGIEVQIAAFPWDVLRQNNINDMLTGAGQFDAVSGSWYLADVFSYFEPLDEYIKRDNFGEGMVPGMMGPGISWRYDGHQIGVPYAAGAYGIAYRTDILKEAGIDPNFKDWDDVLSATKKLQEHLKGTDIAPFVFAFGGNEQTTNLIMADYAGHYINKEGKYEFDVPEATRVFNLIKEFLPYGPSNMTALSIDEANAVFLDGKAAMIPGWVGFMRALADDPTKSKVVGKWAQMEFPGKGFTHVGPWNWFIPKASKNKELAWEWIKAYNSEGFDHYRTEKYGIDPTYISTYTDATALAKHGHDFPIQLKNVAKGHNPPFTSEAFDPFTANVNAFMTDQVDAETAVANLNKAWATLTVPPALLEFANSVGLVEK